MNESQILSTSGANYHRFPQRFQKPGYLRMEGGVLMNVSMAIAVGILNIALINESMVGYPTGSW